MITTKVIISLAVIYMLWDLITQNPVEEIDESTKNTFLWKDPK